MRGNCNLGHNSYSDRTVQQYNPGFMCGRLAPRSANSVTHWKQIKCEDGYFCKDGKKMRCSAPCSPGSVQTTNCTATTNRACTPNPSCSYLHKCKAKDTFLKEVLPSCASKNCTDTDCCSSCTPACGRGSVQQRACTKDNDRVCAICGGPSKPSSPRPIPPSFPVLARARLWCLVLECGVLTSPGG